jgi:competence protein ComEA
MKKMFLVLFLVLFFAASAFAKVNINTADQEALASLTGIGPTKAEAIIKYRKANGAFKSVDDLVNVKGIGDKTFEKIKGEITVDKEKSKNKKKKK